MAEDIPPPAGGAPPPEVNLSQQFEKEKGDPAMIAYLKSLGIDPNYVPPKDDPRRVVISEFALVFKDGHDPIVLKFATQDDILNAKKKPLVVKEGTEFKVRVSFRVQHNVVLGLRLLNNISKMGTTVAKDEEMLGTYPPKNEFQSLELPRLDWNEAPSGMIARGEYKSKMKFVDDDKACHLEFEYILKIAKEWASE
jgi:Rho GDP-dissociation inhibitor